MCALRSAGGPRPASEAFEHAAEQRRIAERGLRHDVREVRDHRSTELQVLPELRHAPDAGAAGLRCRDARRSAHRRSERAEARAQHAVLRRRGAGRWRKLTLIRGDGETASRSHSQAPITSPAAATARSRSPTIRSCRRCTPISSANNQRIVRDHQSLNGIYVRISSTTELVRGAMVLVGEQVLSVDRAARIFPTRKAPITRRA